MAMRLGIDASNYDADLLEPGHMEALKELGFEEIIMGVQRPDIALQIIDHARECGVLVNMVYCGYTGWMFGTKENALQVAKARGIDWVALDCEGFDGAPQDVGVRQQEYLASRDFLQSNGLLTMRYTGEYFWRGEMGDLDIDDPVWLANYGAWDGCNPDPITQVTFGGRVRPVAIHQYASLPELAGRNARDRNYLINLPWGGQVYQQAPDWPSDVHIDPTTARPYTA